MKEFNLYLCNKDFPDYQYNLPNHPGSFNVKLKKRLTLSGSAKVKLVSCDIDCTGGNFYI